VYALSDVIDFVLSLLSDDSKLAAFERDPDGQLDAAGLQGLTGQDVRDAQLVMADNGSARPNTDGGSSGGGGGGGDAVSQITHVTRNYHAAPETTIVQVDDRDTIINDSFNSDDDVTVIDDSFNSSVENDVIAIQDNDTVVNDVTAIQDNDTVVQDNDTVVQNGGPAPEPLRSEGISTGDIVGPEPEPEPEPVFETEVEPVAEAEPEPEPEADVEPDVDAAVV
jgi:hypothetical protein